ncbi:MAG: hypothetical protein Q8R43_02560 [Alphaproteobacteria bacterium]|nr:hypothetical protein [Alphaproteobacteria bacterium]
MKQILQSLLITSVLTLPSVMGANELTADEPRSVVNTMAEQTVLSSGHSNQISFDDAIKILLDSSKSAIGVVKSRLLEFTDKERFILETLINPNSSAWDLYESAGSLIDDYHMEALVAATVFERAANHPEAPREFIVELADSLSSFGEAYYDRAEALRNFGKKKQQNP